MNINVIATLFLALSLSQACNAQALATESLPKVANNLEGDLDYRNEALVLTERKVNGEEVVFGKINTDGTVHLSLPDFDIKALHDGVMEPVEFSQWFLIDSECKDRDPFAKTPYDGIYSKKYDSLNIKKYGKTVAVLSAASSEKIIENRRYDNNKLTVGNRYFWLNMDRSTTYKDKCTKTSFNGTRNIELDISANIELKKGWNLIKESLLETQVHTGDNDYRADIPKRISFTNAPAASKDIKLFLKPLIEAKEVQEAKRLFELAPLTKDNIEKWMPGQVGNFTVTSYEFDKLDQYKRKSNVFIVLENGDKKIELGIVDGAKNPSSLQMANFALAMEKDSQAAGKKQEVDHVIQKDGEGKKSQLLSLFKDRVIVSAVAENVTDDQFWETVKLLKVSELAE